MIPTSSFRNGLKIELGGEPYVIVEFQHVKPGKGGAFVRTKIRNLKTGSVLDKTFRSGEKVAEPDLEEREMEYLYENSGQYYFMDTGNYEQIFLTGEQIGESKGFLKNNIVITVLFYNKEAIGVTLPIFVELEVVETEPGMKGDTATGATKPAKLETGSTIMVPLFIQEGDLLRIDTRTGNYVERVK